MVKEHFFEQISKLNNYKESNLRVQVRCIRLDGSGFEHCWPKFGGMAINNHSHPDFKIPDPPND